MSETTATNSYKQEKFIRTKNESMTITKIPITIAQWIERLNLPCLISTLGLCTIMFWIGAFKFTPTESRQIMVYVEHSPFTSWMYHFFSVQTASDIIGITEMIAATGILLGNSPPVHRPTWQPPLRCDLHGDINVHVVYARHDCHGGRLLAHVSNGFVCP